MFLLIEVLAVNAQIIKPVYAAEKHYNYWVHFPENFEERQQLYPTILFLHGKSLRGSNLELVKKYGVIYEVIRGKKLPFIVIAPQCPIDQSWNPDKLIALLDDAQNRYPIDYCKTYLTGMSMGGYGAFHLAGKYPKRFAAVAALCGGGKIKDACNLTQVPMWVYHGAKDQAVPIVRSQEMVDAIQACGGKHVKFTIYPDWGHGELYRIYRGDELYTWFLSHENQNE